VWSVYVGNSRKEFLENSKESDRGKTGMDYIRMIKHPKTKESEKVKKRISG
jgi:hypothetical protein